MNPSFFQTKKTLNIRGKLLDLSNPIVMGILNVTPDSFYTGSRFREEKAILMRAEQILNEGGTMIDIGGYSSRPQAEDISIEEEKGRVLPAITLIIKEFPEAIISIDTFRAEVASSALAEGASLVNDISGGGLDEKMFETVAQAQVPYVMMHMLGTPQTMSKLNHYEDILGEMIDYFQKKVQELQGLGQKDIILDLGFGFAKNISQNFYLLNRLESFYALNLPLLIGVSRKSMIYKSLQIEPQMALNGTSVLNTVALLKNASILRVHDIKEAVEAIKLANLLIC